MKKKYIIFKGIIITELITALILKKLGISFENTFLGLILAHVFFVTILILLYILSKDKDISPKKRKTSRIAFWFLLFCTASGFVGGLILLII